MEVPKFLVADNSQFQDKIFIVHTEYPRFVLDVSTDEIEWLEPLEKEEELELEVSELLEQAFAFFDQEMGKYEEDEPEEQAGV